MSSTVQRINLNAISQLAKETSQVTEMRDPELKGFGVRRQQAAISYFVHTRIKGRLKRLTIGRHGSPWTPDTARREAAKLLMSIRAGLDPAKERDDARVLRVMFEAVAESFLQIHGPKLKLSTRGEYSRIVHLQLGPKFNGRALADITQREIAAAHASWSKTPRAANHALSVMSKLLTWAQDQGYDTAGDDLCRKVKRYRENKRERYLSQSELQALGEVLAAAEHGGVNPFVIALIRLLMLTGARLGELLTLKWAYVKFERKSLLLPDSKTGAKTIVLNAPAIEVLQRIPRLEHNPWVFVGHIKGSHLSDIQKPWQYLRARAGISDFRIHDLRHTFASVAVANGGSLPVIGKLLGHSQPQTTARYAHLSDDPLRALAERTGEAMRGLVMGIQTGRE